MRKNVIECSARVKKALFPSERKGQDDDDDDARGNTAMECARAFRDV